MPYFQITAHDCKHKAYNRGCMAGMAGLSASRCPYPDTPHGTQAICHKWWIVGWQDGHAAFAERRALPISDTADAI